MTGISHQKRLVKGHEAVLGVLDACKGHALCAVVPVWAIEALVAYASDKLMS